ncbi:unnamed protein product [Calypogeia fissa]
MPHASNFFYSPAIASHCRCHSIASLCGCQTTSSLPLPSHRRCHPFASNCFPLQLPDDEFTILSCEEGGDDAAAAGR